MKKNRISSLQTFDQFRLKDMLLMAYDVAAVTVSYFFALWFRFDGRFTEIPREYLESWMKFAPIYILVSILVLWALLSSQGSTLLRLSPPKSLKIFHLKG